MCVCTRNRVNRPLRGGAPLHRQSAWTAGIRADPAARRPPQPCASAAAPAAFLPLWGRAGILPPAAAAAASAVYGMRRGSGARPSRPGEREETRELDSYATDGSRGGIPLRSLRGSISGPTGRKPTCHQLQSAIAPTQPRLSARRPKPASVTTSYATNCSKWRHHHQQLLSSAPTHPRLAARRSPLHVPSIRGAASSSAAGCVAWACRCGEAGDSDRGAVRAAIVRRGRRRGTPPPSAPARPAPRSPRSVGAVRYLRREEARLRGGRRGAAKCRGALERLHLTQGAAASAAHAARKRGLARREETADRVSQTGAGAPAHSTCDELFHQAMTPMTILCMVLSNHDNGYMV
jgi:hypothetical protein